MFFFISKVLDFIISPLNWIIILFLLYFIVKNKKYKRIFLISSFSFLIFFSNPYIVNSVMDKWELRGIGYKKIDRTYEVGIVLGGFVKYYNSELKTLSFGDASDRLMEGLMLYKKGVIKKILISGGNANLVGGFVEATLAKDFLIKYCEVPSEDILTDTLSKNTFQNAVESVKVLKENKINPSDCLIITSAFHMRRSLACFEKQGAMVTAYCCDQHSGKQFYNPTTLIVPNERYIEKWTLIFHELIGYAIYKMQGYV
jgi:uncharacterized SAM-binding protein YcdF (DUF218 family)